MATAAEITLTKQERSVLERRAAKLTLPYRAVQRAKLVLYAADGLSNTEIAARLEMCTKVVGQWRRRFAADRLDGLADHARSGRPRRFPPEQVAEVTAVACEPPAKGAPLSRRSVADVHRLVIERGISEASASTIVRWLREDAIRPWQYRSWIFPTDPQFAVKAGRILDLYQGRWEGELLHPGDMIISADEKPSIQARGRIAETLPPKRGVARGQRVEHTYERHGALTYLAAWDVRRGGVIGRCEPKGGIKPFGRLVEQVMTREPYLSAPRVFWIVDNGSSHRGQRSVERLQSQWPTLRLVHTPVHASWVNQIEIYFSIVQRKVLTPDDFDDLDQVKQRLAAFERLYNQIADRSPGTSPARNSTPGSLASAPTKPSPSRSLHDWTELPTISTKSSTIRPAQRPGATRADVVCDVSGVVGASQVLDDALGLLVAGMGLAGQHEPDAVGSGEERERAGRIVAEQPDALVGRVVPREPDR